MRDFSELGTSRVPRVERTVSFLFRSLDVDNFGYGTEAVDSEKGVTLEARLAKCKARLQQYIEDDAARNRRNTALLAEVQKLKVELNAFRLEDHYVVDEEERSQPVLAPKTIPVLEPLAPKPSVSTGTDTEDLVCRSNPHEHVDAVAQTSEVDFQQESKDRLVEEVQVPIARKESCTTSEGSYLVGSRRSSAGMPTFRRQSSTHDEDLVEESPAIADTANAWVREASGAEDLKQTILRSSPEMVEEDELVGGSERVEVDQVEEEGIDDEQLKHDPEGARGDVDLESSSPPKDDRLESQRASVVSRDLSEPSPIKIQPDSSTADDDSFFDEGATSVNAAYMKFLGGVSEEPRTRQVAVDDVDDDMETCIASELGGAGAGGKEHPQPPASQSRPKVGSILRKVAGESDEDVSLERGRASDEEDDFF